MQSEYTPRKTLKNKKLHTFGKWKKNSYDLFFHQQQDVP